MKLNIGCGYDYLSGYVNIDADPASAADRVMAAQFLDFPDSSVEEIKALQLVEHLGFFKAKYFLAECWRVLAPGATLLLETPDIQKTFEIFLSGDRAVKEAALGWVYGSETPGMNHLYCFPQALLAELLTEAGFEISARETFDFQPGRPALRFTAVKAVKESAALNAALRRRLAAKGLAGFNCELEAAGVDLVVRRLLACGANKTSALELALYSAPVTLEFFALEEENERHPSPEAIASARLCEAGLQALLTAQLDKSCAGGAVTAELFAAALASGGELVRSALKGEHLAAAGSAPSPAVFTLESARAFFARRRALRMRAV